MSVTVREVASWIDGEVLGDGDLRIDHARPLADAQAGDITFVDSDRHLDDWHHSLASAAIVKPNVPVNGRPIIRVGDPLMAFANVIKRLRGDGFGKSQASIHPTACVDSTAVIGRDVTVGPYVVVGKGTHLGRGVTLHAGVCVGANCLIGDDVTLHPHVTVYDGCTLGDRVCIHANTVIGADGYGYRVSGGRHVKVPQLGTVEIGCDVEIGANTTIDRGTFGPTRIGEGTKIDNLVQIAHNCQIGRHNLIVAQAGIAGSCITGDYVVIAGQVGIKDHMTIGDRAQIGAQSGVIQDVPADARLFGTPARSDRESLRIHRHLDRIGDMVRDIRTLKKACGLDGVKEAA